MAATLTDSGELTHLSFGIEKIESTPDGDLMCYGRASDGSVDHDQQIVDPHFSSKSIREWLESGGNVRVQHNAQRDPAGVGLEVSTDPDGATWVKSLIVEPVAKKLLAAGALRAYSVGIARPTIVRDAVAKGGRITDGQIVEISLVDRPANARCGISLVKSADDGAPEYVGKVFGADDAIAKALDGDTVEKSVAPAEPASIDTWAPPADLNINITPNDLMRVVQGKFVQQHYDDLAAKAIAETEAPVYKRDINTATRRRLASEGSALPDGSYPIESTGDLGNAAHLARTGHGNVAAARRLIARRARELGVANPLDEGDDVKKDAPYTGPVEPIQEALEKVAAENPDSVIVLPPAIKEAEPELTKDPEPEDKDKPVKKAKKKAKKLPPWLNKPADGDGDSDDDDDKSDKAAHCAEAHEHTEKCHTTPAEAAGVSASPMDPAPVKELLETPAPSHMKSGPTPASTSGAVAAHMDPVPAHREPDGAPMEAFEASAKMTDGDDEGPTKLEATMKGTDPEVAVLLRFQRAGIDPEAGRLHDLTCPAYHPEDVAKHHPFAAFSSIDTDAFQRKAVQAAAGRDTAAAMLASEVWHAAESLKGADPGWLNDCRLAAYKAFRDANPGPSSYPTPGCVSPQPYNRPLITDGHEASSPGHAGPNSSPEVATSAPNAHSFDRPPLASGHQSPSPSHMKASFEYPAQQGVPTRLNYGMMEKERQRQALVQMHEHLSRQFPEACPMSLDGPQQPESRPVPPTAGISKAIEPASADEITPGFPAPVAASFKATPEEEGQFADAEIYKSFKKARKKLGKKVLSGKMTVDEARAHLGRQFAQKGGGGDEAAVQKSAHSERVLAPAGFSVLDEAAALKQAALAAAPPVAAPFDPDVIKSAVAEATSELRDLLVAQQETFTTRLAEQQKVIDAIADQPDPSTAAFSGLAFNPAVQKARRPAAVPDQAEYAARAQDMVRRNLTHTYTTHSSPAVREAAGEALAKLGSETPMT